MAKPEPTGAGKILLEPEQETLARRARIARLTDELAIQLEIAAETRLRWDVRCMKYGATIQYIAPLVIILAYMLCIVLVHHFARPVCPSSVCTDPLI